MLKCEYIKNDYILTKLRIERNIYSLRLNDETRKISRVIILKKSLDAVWLLPVTMLSTNGNARWRGGCRGWRLVRENRGGL